MTEARTYFAAISAEPAKESALWRERLGSTLRAVRLDSGARLVDVAERANISPQYLSEIERGRKEPSSEMIAAVLGALEVDLERVLADILARARRGMWSGRGLSPPDRPARSQDALRLEPRPGMPSVATAVSRPMATVSIAA